MLVRAPMGGLDGIELDTEDQTKLTEIVKVLTDKPSINLDIVGRVDPSKDETGLRTVMVDDLIHQEQVNAKDEDTTRSAHSSPHHRLDSGSANVHVELPGWISVKPAACAQPSRLRPASASAPL